MDPELEAYDRAWRETPTEERNEHCQALADAYVDAHPELVQQYGNLAIPELVALVDVAREQGDEERRIELDIWINAAFEYQQIGGNADTLGIRRDLPGINVAGDRRR